MAHQNDPARRVSNEELEAVSRWAESEAGKTQFLESQREVSKWANEELAKATIIEPDVLKRPFNL